MGERLEAVQELIDRDRYNAALEITMSRGNSAPRSSSAAQEAYRRKIMAQRQRQGSGAIGVLGH